VQESTGDLESAKAHQMGGCVGWRIWEAACTELNTKLAIGVEASSNKGSIKKAFVKSQVVSN